MSAEDGAPLADVPFIKAPMPDRRDFPREVRVGNEKCDYCGQPGIQFGDVLVCIDHAAKVDTHRYTPSEVESLVQQVAECEWLLRMTMDARDRAERQAERLEARIARTVEGGARSAMPNQPRPDNRPHMIRVPDDLWSAAVERAAERGESVSEAVRRMLARYVR